MAKKNQEENAAKIFCFSSGKGGVGKTSITVNVATYLAIVGKKVLLVDGDLGLANVDIVLGLNIKRTLQETVEEGADLKSIIVKVANGFYILPASSGVPEMANLSYEEQAFLTNNLDDIVDEFDYVLLDTSAGIGESVLWLNNWAKTNIVILSPDPTSMTDAYALIKVLASQYGKEKFHLIINIVKSKKEGREVFNSMAAVLNNFLKIDPALLGMIPQDLHVVQAIRSQKPFILSHPQAKASQAIKSLAEEIIKFDQ